MTKAVLEAESEGEAEQLDAVVPSPALAVPASLHASLMARLDRLGPPRRWRRSVLRSGGSSRMPCWLRWCASRSRVGIGARPSDSAGLLFRQGVPPYSTYLFKHALVQDAAYGTLLREPRRVLHARITETLESQFAEIPESQPELLARHCTEAGLIEKAAGLWGKAGQRSLERSALVEAAEQLTRALDQIAALPATPALRREEVKLQVALMTPLIHVKGYAAPETKAAAERARLLIEQAEARGEPPEDPLLLFSVLYGFWVANFVAFNGDVCRDLAKQLLALAAKKGTAAPPMIGHYIMGNSLLFRGDLAEARAHYDKAVTLYAPSEHRPLAMRFGQDVVWQRCPFGHGPCGSLAIPMPHSQTPTKRSVMRARWSRCHTDVRAGSHAAANFLSAKFATAIAQTTNFSCGGRKTPSIWKAVGMVLQGEPVAVRQGLGCNPNDLLRAHRVPVNGSNTVCALLVSSWPARMWKLA